MRGAGEPEVSQLSDAEQRLVDASRSGDLLDLADGHLVQVEAAETWQPDRLIRAAVLRDLLLGRHGELDPRGIRLRAARIRDVLDLDDARTSIPLRLTDCHVHHITAHRAHLSHVELIGVHTTALHADNLQLDHDLNLVSFHTTGSNPRGAIRLLGAQITGNLNCSGAKLTNSKGPALHADRLQVGGGALFRSRFEACGTGPLGAVRLLGARITGNLECVGAKLTNSDGPALHADGLQVDGEVFCGSGFEACGAGPAGAVRLLGARITGNLDYVGAKLTNSDGPALDAANLQVGGNVFLRDRFEASGAGPAGAVELLGARITGNLECDGAKLTGTDGPALQAGGLQVGGEVFCRSGFEASGAGPAGAIELIGARITGNLNCDGAKLTNSGGPALYADRLQVGGNVFLRDPFEASGAGPAGAVRLPRAHITGHLECDGAKLSNSDGPALDADGLQVGGTVFLRNRFEASGAEPDGAVRLHGAHIGGNLNCDGAKLTNSDGPALLADRLIVAASVFLRDEFEASGNGPLGVIRLSGVRISGQLGLIAGIARHREDGLALDLHEAGVGQLYLEPTFADRVDTRNLRYDGLPHRSTISQWLRWLGDPAIDYTAQPYQHLAAAHRAAGHHTDARRILIAQQHDLARRGGLTGWLKLRHRILGRTLGYGYQSWRALAALLATVAVAVAIAIAAGSHGIATHTKDTTTPGAHCSLVEQIGLGVDLGAPLINTGTRARCALTTDHNTTGSILTATSWLLQLLGFAFATLFIAGFTGVIRKD